MPTHAEDTLNDLMARLGGVRRWLLALRMLKTTAAWMIAISVHVNLYALADHRLHFGRMGRLAALAGLLALLTILFHRLFRMLRRETSYIHVANHVEARHSFDQQLVAAAEYYEKGADYPYSKRLARQLVLNLDEASRDFAFDSTVDKQRGYVLAGCIAIYLTIVSLFVYHYVRDVASSVAQTISPMAAAQPAPAAAGAQPTAAGSAPGIEEIEATIRVERVVGETTEKVRDFMLEALPGSQVELHIKATTPLQEATIGGIEDKPIVQKLDSVADFRVPFKVDKPLSLSFRLLSTEGTANTAPLTMQVKFKSDTPPQFKLLSPDGDCLATDVASIPIVFAVTDDFGLDQAQLCCQMPSGSIVVLDGNSPQGARQLQLSAILELEQYDLHVGDSILFYAKARDVVTGYRSGDPNASSEIYFIEIRPYRQYWHPPESATPSTTPGPSAEDLLTILEYTRSIVKRTWSLAQAPPPAEKQREEIDKVRSDTDYSAKRLAKLRDDPDNHFTDGQKAYLTRVTGLYDDIMSALAVKDANKAVDPAQQAYRLLRKFIDELHLKMDPPDSSPSPPQEKPQRVKLQEQPGQSDQDKERAEGQLEKAQNQIDTLARQEKALKADLAKATQQSGGQKSEGRGQQRGDQGRQGQGGSPGQSESRGRQDGPSNGKGGVGSGGENGQPSTDAMLRMLQARQNALRQQASQLSADLARLALPASSGQSAAKDAARQRLDQAVANMKQLEDKLAEARYSPEAPGKKEPDAAALAESAARELSQAGQAIGRALTSGKELTDAEKAEAMAKQLAKDAESVDESLSPQEKQEMMDRLKAAERLLENMVKPQWQTVSGPGGGDAAQAYTRNASTSPAETARMLSRQFWSVAIQARNRQMRATENEPSDARFFELENQFFEDAAKFKPQQSSK
jgi:hypothetical protein